MLWRSQGDGAPFAALPVKRSTRYARRSAKEKRGARRERLRRIAVRREQLYERSRETFVEALGFTPTAYYVDPWDDFFD